MIKYRLLHPQLLSVLGRAGHGNRVLIADANYRFVTGEQRLFANLLLEIGVVSV